MIVRVRTLLASGARWPGVFSSLLCAAATRAVGLKEGVSVIRVMVVDDQPLVRAGLTMVVNTEDDIAVIAEAADGQDALIQARIHRPDVILMDVCMPGLDGVAATRAVISEGLTAQNGQPIKVIILTTYEIEEAVTSALRAGAVGFLLKAAAPAEIVAAIRAVVAGEGWLDHRVTLSIIADIARQPEQHTPTPAQMAQLTRREREVLALLAKGLSNAEVAKHLFISEYTVKTHVARLMAKLDVREKAQAVAVAYQSGLVQPSAH
jgi:DNA-binding NarL/FixJ family response regulator